MKFFVIGGLPDKDVEENEKAQFREDCIKIGKTLSEMHHSLIICSPFKISADYWIVDGFYKNKLNENQKIFIHYVDDNNVKNEIGKMKKELSINDNDISNIPHHKCEKGEEYRYSWLLCQLEALEQCNVVIAIGGKKDGVANMLLRLAESKRKPIIPFSYWGGAALECFYRKRYELQDIIGEDYILLSNSIKDLIDEKIKSLLFDSVLKNNNKILLNRNEKLKIFISYPRARPNEADYVETVLRRRNLNVFRDESEFGAGSSIPNEITEAIFSSNVFIALWCAEYACSPWCFDEFELAISRYKNKKIQLWILCLDKTRIIPPDARTLLSYNVTSREEIEGVLLKLIESFNNEEKN